DDLGVALVELGLDARHVAQLGGAHRGEILWVREEDGPLIADPLVEVDRTLGRLRSEVGGFVVDTQRHGTLLFAIGGRYRNALWARTPPGPTGRPMGPDAVRSGPVSRAISWRACASDERSRGTSPPRDLRSRSPPPRCARPDPARTPRIRTLRAFRAGRCSCLRPRSPRGRSGRPRTSHRRGTPGGSESLPCLWSPRSRDARPG